MVSPVAKAKPTAPKIQFAPDAWERFETLVRSAAKIGHKPHAATPPQRKKVVKKKTARTVNRVTRAGKQAR